MVFQFFHLRSFAALSFTIPYLITAVFLGPEFPSIIGGLFGMGLVTLAIKCNFLLPQKTWDFDKRSQWPKYWFGDCKNTIENNKQKKIGHFNFLVSIYSFLAFLLILSRTNDKLNMFLKSVNINFF